MRTTPTALRPRICVPTQPTLPKIHMHIHAFQLARYYPLTSAPTLLSVLTSSFSPPFIPTSLKALIFQQLIPSIIIDTNPTMATAETQPTFGKYIQFDLNTGAIIDKATEYLKPEKLTALLENHKSPSPSTHFTLSHRTNKSIIQAGSSSPASGSPFFSAPGYPTSPFSHLAPSPLSSSP